MLRFDDRVAIVTGAGNGLGREYALWLAARGAKVVVNNRAHADQPSSAEAVVRAIRESGGVAVADQHAVEDESSAEAMVQTALKEFGRLDILVCNAGVSNARQPLETLSMQQIRQTMDINFYGTLGLVRAALPAMIAANYGRVVLTTSTNGLYGSKDNPVYSASKSALIGLARGVAHDNAARNIRVNLIAPAARTYIGRVIPEQFNELMSPAHVAPVVGWLCSEGCASNGLILFAGAGRVRQVFIVEGASAQAVAGPPASLGDLSHVYEPKDLQDSVFKLVPELGGKDGPWAASP